MKDVELKLLCELMKDSRRSDRELAKAVGVSQPTVTRTRGKLEKEGYIKEYTIIPDFRKLGYNVMGVTLLKHNEPVTEERSAELRKAVIETEKQNPHASLMAVSGMGLQKNKLFITLYEDYSAYWHAMQLAKAIPHIVVESLESFLVDLNDESNYRLLSMAAIARHLSLKEEG